MIFKDLLDDKVPRVRRAIWTPPVAYLKLTWLPDGKPCPWAFLYRAEEQEAIDQPTRQLVSITNIDREEIDWVEYTGPACAEDDPDIISEHERSIEHILAEASGAEYRPLRSLAEAQQVPDGRVILDGDWGGQVYLSCPASMVRCSQEVLHRLLLDIDARCWACNEGGGAGVYFERKPVGAEVSGGMGGGIVTDGLWLHEEVEGFGIRAQIEEILAGHHERLECLRGAAPATGTQSGSPASP
jgi:hypothetical protein